MNSNASIQKPGLILMGSACTKGEGRALMAIEKALASLMLNGKNINGANKVFLYIISGKTANLLMEEITIITEYVQAKAGEKSDLIYFHEIDKLLGESIRVTVNVSF